MPVPGRRAPQTPWQAGALRLATAALLASPALFFLTQRRWAFFAGAFVLALLALGALERLWQARPLPRRYRPVDRGRFRVLDGGKGKGNGHAHDVPEAGDEPDGPRDKPRWLM